MISEESIKSKYCHYIDLYREAHEEYPHYFHGHIAESVIKPLLDELYPEDLLKIHFTTYKWAQWKDSKLIEAHEEEQIFLVYDTNGPDRFPVTEVWAFEEL